MRMCQTHWERLKELVKASGMGHLIKQGPEALTTFDPLMVAHNAILGNALQARGLSLMMLNEDGSDRCPICFVRDTCTCGRPDCRDSIEKWPENAVSDVLEEAKKLGAILQG